MSALALCRGAVMPENGRAMRVSMRLSLCLALAAVSGFAQGGFNGPGRYEITNLKSGRSMGVDRDSVVQFSGQGSANLEWDVETAGGGYYMFRSVGNGMALDAAGESNSTPLQTRPYSGSPNQQWRIERGKDGNALIVARNGKTLDIPDGSSREGIPVQIYDLNGDSNQRFIFHQVSGVGVRGSSLGRILSSGAGRAITCSSDDGRRNQCPADTRAGVRLTRQISGSPCREGETWGYDRNGIWVDRGCRAEFETGGGFRPPVRAAEQPRSNGGYQVRCSSDDGRRNYCAADTRGGVRLTRQISGSPCREGQTWGYDRNGIWVDRGCRAEFAVGRR